MCGSVRFTYKARDEMRLEGIKASDVYEAIVNAQRIFKVLNSRSRLRGGLREKLYVIKSFSFEGTLIYTKGKIVTEGNREYYYIFISAKINTIDS
ncbi:MAG: hypothetical protein HOP29_05100 [Phycisphaerales bacterium]|nr:hypothetical protein [Phycisphaerales bacterium]